MKRIVGVGIILATGAALLLGNFALASTAAPSPAQPSRRAEHNNLGAGTAPAARAIH
jgi:hypothetical protein